MLYRVGFQGGAKICQFFDEKKKSKRKEMTSSGQLNFLKNAKGFMMLIKLDPA